MTSKGYTTGTLVSYELQTTISASSSPTLTEVNTWIEEAEDLIDNRLGTGFTSGTSTTTNVVMSFDEHTAFIKDNNSKILVPGQDTFGGNKNDSVYLLDSNGLKVSPIISITSLYRNTAGSDISADSWELLSENTGSGGDYMLDKSTGLVQFQQNTPYFGLKRAIKWSGAAGYSSIPLRIQTLATKLVAQRALQTKVKKAMFSNTDSYTLEGFSRKKELGQNVTYLQELDRDVDKLWEQLSGAFQSEVAK